MAGSSALCGSAHLVGLLAKMAVILLRNFNLHALYVVAYGILSVHPPLVENDLIQVDGIIGAVHHLLVLDLIQEVRAELLLRGLGRVALHVLVVVIYALAEVKLEVRVHVLLGVLGEAHSALRHAIVEHGVRLLLALVLLAAEVASRGNLQEVWSIYVLAERCLHD